MDEDKTSLIKNNIVKVIIILGVLIVVVGAFVFFKRQNEKVYSKYTVENKIENDPSIKKNYMKYAEGYIAYSNDGISYIKSGKEVWNKAIAINVPVIDICGDYIALADQNTNGVNLFDLSGNQIQLSMTYPVLSLEVSEQGVVAAILDGGESNYNYVELKDKNNEQIAWGQTVISGDGYPMDISLSNDGTKMVASYLAVSSGNTQSKVVFYNYSSIGQNEVDRIVGGFNQYKSTIVPKVEFINNNTAVAFGDSMFTIYSMKKKPSIIKEETFEDKIQSVFYSSKYIGIVFQSSDSSSPYYVKVYNKSGKKILTQDIDIMYNDISFVGDNIVMNSENQCLMISISGKKRFDYTFDKSIIKLIPLSDSKYIVVSDDKVEQIKLK